jgi:hypothetical protein
MLFRSTEFARAVFFAAIVAGSSLPASAAAITLDLTKTPVQWTNSGGSYSASFDVDAANAGNDVTIRLSFVGGAQMVNGSPSVGANGINLNVWTNANASLRIDFDFHYTAGVTDLKVMTNDVDLNAMGQMEELRALYSSFGTSGQQALGIQCCSTGAQRINGGGLTTSLLGMVESGGAANSNATLMALNKAGSLSMTFGVRDPFAFQWSQSDFNLNALTWSTGTAAPVNNPIYIGHGASIDQPEPATWLTLATGIGLLAWQRRRRRKSA